MKSGFLVAICVVWVFGADAEGEPYVMERTDVRTVTSETGAHYRVYIHSPTAPAPEAGYPVLYLLDGDDSFSVAAQTSERLVRYGARRGVFPGLIVAIGYAPDDMSVRRAFDYTPASRTTLDRRGRATGGAAVFRDFLADRLLPGIRSEFPVDESRETIWGHSYGGLFVLDTLFEQPDLFDTYISSSPSIWFGDAIILDKLDGFEARLNEVGPKTLARSVGEMERRVPPCRQR